VDLQAGDITDTKKDLHKAIGDKRDGLHKELDFMSRLRYTQ
jgi:hypothetical protein